MAMQSLLLILLERHKGDFSAEYEDVRDTALAKEWRFLGYCLTLTREGDTFWALFLLIQWTRDMVGPSDRQHLAPQCSSLAKDIARIFPDKSQYSFDVIPAPVDCSHCFGTVVGSDRLPCWTISCSFLLRWFNPGGPS